MRPVKRDLEKGSKLRSIIFPTSLTYILIMADVTTYISPIVVLD